MGSGKRARAGAGGASGCRGSAVGNGWEAIS
jgi:hypothetical protein